MREPLPPRSVSSIRISSALVSKGGSIMALAYSKGMAPGTPAPPFSLPGTDGKTYSLDSFRDSDALVIVFTCNHCPYANAWEDRLMAIQNDYATRGVRIVA